MNILTGKLARVLYALPFAFFGINHLVNASKMTGYVPSFFPAPQFWVYLTGLAFIAASISLLIEKKARLAGILLGIMLLIFVLTIHLPGVIGASGMQEMMQYVPSLLKDTALAGAAWHFAGHYGEGATSSAETEL